MDWVGLGNRLLDLIGRTALTRFCSGLIVIGASLLTVSWPDVVAAVLGVVIDKSNSEKYAFLSQWTGLGLIVVGIVGRLLLHFVFAAWHEKRVAATLVGRLRVLANGFRPTGVSRDAGYFNEEIQSCQKAAKEYLSIVPPPALAASATLASIANPKFDASKVKPYFDISLNDIDRFIEQLRKTYEIE